MFLRGRKIADHDGGQRVGAFQPHQMAGIKLHVDDVDTGAVGYEIAPVLPRGRVQRRGDDLEVDGVVGIGQDEQLIAVIRDGILHAVFALRNKTRLGVRRAQIDQALFGRLMVAARDHAEASAGAFVDVREPAGILFLVNQRVAGLRRAEGVPVHLHRAMVVVELHIEERFRIRGPDHVAVGFLDMVGVILAGCPVADADGEIFRTARIRAPRLQLVIGRMLRAAELEVLASLRFFIAIDDEAGFAATTRLAADLLVLAALAVLVEIGERAVGRGDAGVVLLDAAAHFRHQLFLQRLRMAQHRVGVDILGFEIGADVRLEHRWVAQHLLPVLVLQPRIVIGHGDVVMGEAVRAARRDGRNRRFGRHGAGPLQDGIPSS